MSCHVSLRTRRLANPCTLFSAPVLRTPSWSPCVCSELTSRLWHAAPPAVPPSPHQGYYFEGKPTISDQEFDLLKDELLWSGSRVAALT